MDRREAAVALYQTSMSQFMARIAQRDTMLLFFLAAAGTVCGFAYREAKPLPQLLLVVPYLAGTCGSMMAYQTLFVESIVDYFDLELRGAFEDLVPFELGDSFAARGMLAVKFRTMGNFFTLVIPAVVALSGAWSWSIGSPLGIALWWCGFLVGVIGPVSLVTYDLSHIRSVRRRQTSAVDLSSPMQRAVAQSSDKMSGKSAA